jgi:hypothetical protein
MGQHRRGNMTLRDKVSTGRVYNWTFREEVTWRWEILACNIVSVNWFYSIDQECVHNGQFSRLEKRSGPGLVHSPTGPGPTIWVRSRHGVDLDPDIWGPVRQVQDRTLDSLEPYDFTLLLVLIILNTHKTWHAEDFLRSQQAGGSVMMSVEGMQVLQCGSVADENRFSRPRA